MGRYNTELGDNITKIDKFVVKKNGTRENFDINKVVKATSKSANRVMHKFTPDEVDFLCTYVTQKVLKLDGNDITIDQMHNIAEKALSLIDDEVADSYRSFRNYKQDFVAMLDDVYKEVQRIMYIGDKENSNTDSALVSTKRSLIYNQLNKELYKKFFLTTEELQACKDGYIYIHDMSARRDTMNCCIADIKSVMTGGFEMGNLDYCEPKTLDVAFDVIGDIVLSAASQQYGGFTVPEIDKLLRPYAEKELERLTKKYRDLGVTRKTPEEQALIDITRILEQGFQGFEMKFNSVASSRGDYPFIAMTSGLDTSEMGRLINRVMFRVRANGQGKPGHKRVVLFPKLIMLYDENIHDEGKIANDVFEAAIDCSSKAMYPDWLSLTGDGYVASMYKQYGKVVSPMGCVDGKEVITYKFKDKLYVESFERMWNRLYNEFGDNGQNSSEDRNRVIDLKNKGLEVWDTKDGFVELKYLIRNIQSNWCDITLSNGRYIRVTKDHVFTTENRGDVYAEDLKIDDKITISSNQYVNNSINIDESLAWLYGLMLCDGCYEKYSLAVSIGQDEENDIGKYFIDSFSKHFEAVPRVVYQNRGKKGNYIDLRVYSDGGKFPLMKFHEKFKQKFGGVKKIDRQIPNEVFCYNESSKYSFLAGMIDADGYISKDSSKTRHVTAHIGSTNKELALQQLYLIQSLGMQARMYINHYSKKDSSKVRYKIEFFPNKELIEHMKSEKKKEKFVDFAQDEYKCTAYVKKIEEVDIGEQYSYDVTTESEHFEVSGIYSHNCRAFLSPWYERGGMYPEDKDDEPVFVGRFNIGVVSLNLPMILAKSRQESKDFYVVLDYYLEMIRNIHLRTYEYLGEMKASVNPLMYCEGGFYGGHLKPDEKIKSILKPMTASFGITALNELQQLYNKKSIREDGQFALEVMTYINKKIDKFKKKDGVLYAIYGTPAENLCGLQVKQFRQKYGIIPNVSDREYVSNSFHCHVSEEMSPIEKQDKEARFWNLFNGGKIQYVKYPVAYNKDAIRTLVKRAMKKGLYEGVNLSLAYCNQCGHEELNMNICPHCGSDDITKIERMNGYLSYSRVHGDTRLNSAKMAEIKDRVSM